INDAPIPTDGIVDEPPVAEAGTDKVAGEGVPITLDGSNSFDPDHDGNIVSFEWKQIEGPAVELSDSFSIQPSFITPHVGLEGTALIFELTVTDTSGFQSADTCTVNVTWQNNPPVADAGSDQNADKNAEVILNGSHSNDSDDGIAVYRWEQTNGPAVELRESNTAQASFITPDIGDESVTLDFKLTVADKGGLSSSDTCIVNIIGENDPPVANAGADQEVREGTTVTLDARDSVDPDDGIGSYLWEQTAGPFVALSDPTAVQPTFVTPSVGSQGASLGFTLKVTDIGGLSATDSVEIAIVDNGINVFPEGIISTDCSTGLPVGINIENGGNIVNLSVVDLDSIPETPDKPQNFIYGMLDIDLKVTAPGDTATVIIYLPEPAPEGYVWYKYSPSKGWYDYSAHAEFNVERDQITLTLTDGDIGDDDGIANKLIKDPSGLGQPPASAEPIVTDNEEGGCLSLLYPANGQTGLETTVSLKCKKYSGDVDGNTIYQFYCSPNQEFLNCSPITVTLSKTSSACLISPLGLLLFPGLLPFSRCRKRKKIIKVLFFVFLVVSLALVLCGCSGGGGEDDKTEKKHNEDTNDNKTGNGDNADEVICEMTNLSPATTYYWKVVVDDGQGNKMKSAVWNFTTK
ncbi:MAG: choice-of-anchor U domain-containing protein, partial [Pseudomonadota bacterium]